MSTTITPRPVLAPGSWMVDPAHSSVEFQVKHMGIATVKGLFMEFTGELMVGEDGAVTAGGVVRADSLDTRSAQRDEHLRSPDFFDVENHPEIRFLSTTIEQLDENSYRIVGDLTIRGITRSVEFDAVSDGIDQDPWGSVRAGLEIVGQINRDDFGLTWNQALESGGVLVGKKVKILLHISAVKC